MRFCTRHYRNRALQSVFNPLARTVFIRSLALLAFVACAAAFTSSARANTITVNGLGDTLSNNGVCTIREAVINANNDAATWADCAASSGADVINLPAGTITLSLPNAPSSFTAEEFAMTGDLDILGSLTINGDPAGTTIDGAQLDRIFDINPDTDVNDPTPTPSIVVNINGLTVTNGRQNDVGGIRVNANSTVTIDSSTISNNTSSANDSGGIYNGGTLTMTNSTISGNFALLLAGGIKNDGNLTLKSCTVTNNHSSFANLITGVLNSGTLTIGNTIIAGNGGTDFPNLTGNSNSLGYNIIGSLGTSGIDPFPVHGTGDQVGVSDAAVQLGPLQNNGGPTPTHALGAGSIALDKGNSFGLTADQRGLTRPCDDPTLMNATGGDGSDVGAFELQGVCSNVPPDAVDDSPNVAEDSGANAINVLGNDTDANNDSLTVTMVTQGAHGSVAITGGGTGVSYTPNANFFGADSFTYTIDDGHGGTDTATVHVNVTNVNDPPVAVGDAYDTNSNTPLNVTAPGVLGNDSDIDGDTLSAQIVSNPSHAASFALNSNGSFSYTPTMDFAGTDSFTYRAFDGAANSNVVTVVITVHDTVPPVLSASVATASLWPPNHELVNVGLSVTATDNSGDPVQIQVSVFSDEDDLTGESGDFSPDAKNIAPGTLRLRSERNGAGDGRVYLIVVTATDSSNNVSRKCLAVVVPHDQSKGSKDSVNAQAAAAVAYCMTNGTPPPGYFVVGDGPVIGPKQ